MLAKLVYISQLHLGWVGLTYVAPDELVWSASAESNGVKAEGGVRNSMEQSKGGRARRAGGHVAYISAVSNKWLATSIALYMASTTVSTLTQNWIPEARQTHDTRADGIRIADNCFIHFVENMDVRSYTCLNNQLGHRSNHA